MQMPRSPISCPAATHRLDHAGMLSPRYKAGTKKVAGTARCSSNPRSRGMPMRGPYSHWDISVRRRASAGSSRKDRGLAVDVKDTAWRNAPLGRLPGPRKTRVSAARRGGPVIRTSSSAPRRFRPPELFRTSTRRMNVFLEPHVERENSGVRTGTRCAGTAFGFPMNSTTRPGFAPITRIRSAR